MTQDPVFRPRSCSDPYPVGTSHAQLGAVWDGNWMLRASSVPPGQAEPRLQRCSKPREWQLTSQEAQGGHDGADPADLLGRSSHLLSESHEENPKGLEHPHDEHIDLNGEGVEVRCHRGSGGRKSFSFCFFCAGVGGTNWDA